MNETTCDVKHIQIVIKERSEGYANGVATVIER